MPLRLSDERFVEVKAVPGGQGDVFGVPEGVLECQEVFWGCWMVYGRLKGMCSSLFPSISFNFRKSQMKSVTFSSRPRGPKCCKYQMSQCESCFDLLGSLERGFRAEL